MANERRPSRSAAAELTGAGRTKLSPSAAARARDIDRPTEAELAAAEASIRIVHAPPRRDAALPQRDQPEARSETQSRDRRRRKR